MRQLFRHFTHRLAAVACLALVAALAIGCGAQEEPAAPVEETGVRVERPDLGIALASVPEGFTVVEGTGDALVLERTDGTPGTLSYVPGTTTVNPNLNDAVNGHKAETLEQANGEYKGMIELGSQLGPAYASRGRFGAEGNTTEDFRIFVLHPAGDRLLNLVYQYPAGDDTAERRDELLSALAEVEGMLP